MKSSRTSPSFSHLYRYYVQLSSIQYTFTFLPLSPVRTQLLLASTRFSHLYCVQFISIQYTCTFLKLISFGRNSHLQKPAHPAVSASNLQIYSIPALSFIFHSFGRNFHMQMPVHQTLSESILQVYSIPTLYLYFHTFGRSSCSPAPAFLTYTASFSQVYSIPIPSTHTHFLPHYILPPFLFILFIHPFIHSSPVPAACRSLHESRNIPIYPPEYK